MIDRDEVEPDTPLSNYSLDSLVSVELRNWIRRQTGVELALPRDRKFSKSPSPGNAYILSEGDEEVSCCVSVELEGSRCLVSVTGSRYVLDIVI